LPEGFVKISVTSPVAMRPTIMAQPIASAGRLCPCGPLGILPPLLSNRSLIVVAGKSVNRCQAFSANCTPLSQTHMLISPKYGRFQCLELCIATVAWRRFKSIIMILFGLCCAVGPLLRTEKISHFVSECDA
jgi:hypothetical protein